MNPSDPTPTLHALGRASPSEARSLSPSSTPQLRAAEDLATALLLAQSPSPEALPAGTFGDIQARIARRERQRLILARATRAAQWSGWAVAAALVVWISWPPNFKGSAGQSPASIAAASPDTATSPTTADSPAAAQRPGKGNATAANSAKAAAAAASRSASEVNELRNEVAALRLQVSQLTSPQPGVHRLAILQPKAAPLDSKAIVSLVGAALQPALARATGKAPATGPEIVIESGYAAFNAADLPPGYYYRHRAFPAEQWQSLGLLASEDGSFYDQNGGLVWQPDASGDGSYIGTPPQPGFDLASYSDAITPPAIAAAAKAGGGSIASASNPAKPKASGKLEPTVVAVVSPETGDGQLIVADTNLEPGRKITAWQPRTDPGTGRVVGYTPIGQALTSPSQNFTNPQLAMGPQPLIGLGQGIAMGSSPNLNRLRLGGTAGPSFNGSDVIKPGIGRLTLDSGQLAFAAGASALATNERTMNMNGNGSLILNPSGLNTWAGAAAVNTGSITISISGYDSQATGGTIITNTSVLDATTPPELPK